MLSISSNSLYFKPLHFDPYFLGLDSLAQLQQMTLYFDPYFIMTCGTYSSASYLYFLFFAFLSFISCLGSFPLALHRFVACLLSSSAASTSCCAALDAPRISHSWISILAVSLIIASHQLRQRRTPHPVRLLMVGLLLSQLMGARQPQLDSRVQDCRLPLC